MIQGNQCFSFHKDEIIQSRKSFYNTFIAKALRKTLAFLDLLMQICFFRCSLLLSSSFPSSQQSPELKRKSWNPVTSVSAAGTGLLDPESPEAPLNYEDAKAEALHLICQLNSVFRYKQSEAGLNKLKGRAPDVFRDLCFYSDICQVLGEYDFRRNARKFVQVLFSSVEVAQVRAP